MASFGWSAAAASFAALLTAGGARAEVGGLLSHRAVYELSLKAAEGAHAPAAARGLIVFDIQGSSCEGWTTTFRQITDVTPSEGETRRSDMTSNAFEEPDFSAMRFRVETREAQTSKLVQGAASRSEGGLSIALTRPMRQKVDLGEEARFPTHQTLGVIEAARAGRSTYEVRLFDGSDSGQKVYETTTLIGPARVDAAPEAAAQDEALKGHVRWPVTMSYFEPGSADRAPAYVLSYDLYDNGVSRNLTLDYGVFALAGTLKEIKVYPGKACERPNASDAR
ncbi:MAG: cell envelope integrity EipB family protein [Rhodoblastus sp.]|nr:MAG: cell envelope integrity EipB family protein [Rhodoblastus sp.]